MKVIGLTGGIGTGKSTVARFLAGLGAVTMDLDKVGHEALRSGKARDRIVNEFGGDILGAGGEIDRSRLAGIVFNDRKSLQRLNNILHPVIDDMVDDRLAELKRQGADVVVLEAAAMLESGRTEQADEIWVTIAPVETALGRLGRRPGYSEEEMKTRIQSQLSNEERLKHADVVIDTDCSLDELKKRVKSEWQKLQARI
jgi:dephospho-CoA kinase